MGAAHRKEDHSHIAEGRKRLLVTGSREWPSEPAVVAAILAQWVAWGRPPITIIQGGARGVDTMAAGAVDIDLVVRGVRPFKVETYPADWDVHGRAAGHIRNAEMVSLGADLCLAFIFNDSPWREQIMICLLYTSPSPRD